MSGVKLYRGLAADARHVAERCFFWYSHRVGRFNHYRSGDDCLTPQEVRYRKSIDHLKAALERAEDEPQACRLVAQINELVREHGAPQCVRQRMGVGNGIQ